MTRSHTSPPPSRGFTFVELVIALGIVTMLTVFALPTWQRYLERGWRMQARTELVAAMLALERHALLTSTFAAEPGGTTVADNWPRAVPAPPARARHWLTATSCAGMDLSRCVEVRAAPVHTDAACGTLVLRSSGEWLSMPSGDSEPVPMPMGC